MKKRILSDKQRRWLQGESLNRIGDAGGQRPPLQAMADKGDDHAWLDGTPGNAVSQVDIFKTECMKTTAGY